MLRRKNGAHFGGVFVHLQFLLPQICEFLTYGVYLSLKFLLQSQPISHLLCISKILIRVTQALNSQTSHPYIPQFSAHLRISDSSVGALRGHRLSSGNPQRVSTSCPRPLPPLAVTYCTGRTVGIFFLLQLLRFIVWSRLITSALFLHQLEEVKLLTLK